MFVPSRKRPTGKIMHTHTHTQRLQKTIIRIIMGCRSNDSCRKLFFNLEILPLPPQYILSLLWFMIKNIGINLLSSLKYIMLTLGNVLIFTNLPWNWLNTRREVLRCLICFLFMWKERLINPRNLNCFYSNFYMKIPCYSVDEYFEIIIIIIIMFVKG